MLLTKAALEERRKKISDLKEQLSNVRKEKGLNISQADGDTWHDNFGFEEAEREENRLIGEIRRIEDSLRDVTIITEGSENGCANVGSLISVEVDYGDDEIETIIARLVATDIKSNEEITISINSPIGKAVRNQKIGYTTEIELPRGCRGKLKLLKIEF